MEFEKLSAPSLKELFVQQMETLILSEQLPVGAQLPPERELARQMQVSRAVVNGGVAELAHKGFLEIRPRQGTFVADYRRSGNMDTLIALMRYRGGSLGKKEVRAILEVRRALEPLAVRLAIENAGEEDIARLGRIVDELAEAQTPGPAAEIAFRFQHELAFVGGNTILPLLYYSFKTPVIMLWGRFCRLHGVEALYRNTWMLFEYIRARDGEAAQRWIDTYLAAAIEGNQQIYQ